MLEIKIHPEIKKLLRLLSPEERAELEARISVEGVRDPLCVFKLAGEWFLLDGHNRFEIAQKKRLQYRTVEIRQVTTLDEALEWVARNQLARRNLTPDDMSYWRGEIYEMLKRRGAGRPFRTENKLAHNEPIISTAQKLAKEHGVAPATIKRDAEYARAVDKIVDVAGPQAKTKLLSAQTPVKQKKDVVALARVAESKPDVVREVMTGETSITKALGKSKPFTAPRTGNGQTGPTITQAEARGALWTLATKVLCALSGMGEGHARAFVGKLIKDCGGREEIVAAAIGMAAYKFPADPAAYMISIVQRLKQKKELGDGTGKIVGAAAPVANKYANRK